MSHNRKSYSQALKNTGKPAPLKRNGVRREAALEKQLDFPRYMPGPVFPDRYGSRILSAGIYADAGATASTFGYLTVNSLLTTDHSGPSMSHNPSLVNLGKAYASYRVTKFRTRIVALSRSATTTLIVVGAIPENPAPSTGSGFSYSLATIGHLNMSTLPGTSAYSPNVLKMQNSQTTFAIAGTSDVLTDVDYAGTANSSGVFTGPTKPIYFVMHSGLYTGNFTASTAPLYVIQLEQWVEFYDRRN